MKNSSPECIFFILLSKTQNMHSSLSNDVHIHTNVRPFFQYSRMPMIWRSLFGGYVWQFYSRCFFYLCLSPFCSPETFAYPHILVLSLPYADWLKSTEGNTHTAVLLLLTHWKPIFALFFSTKSLQPDLAKAFLWCKFLFHPCWF